MINNHVVYFHCIQELPHHFLLQDLATEWEDTDWVMGSQCALTSYWFIQEKIADGVLHGF